MNKYIYLLLSTFFVFAANAQPGGVTINTSEALESYTLLKGAGEHHLINNCGESVHSWVLPPVSFHSKLLPNGNLLYIKSSANQIEEKDWEGNIVSTESVGSTSDLELIYEVVKMPNGNYLAVARRTFSSQQFSDIGWSSSVGIPSQVDVIIEFDPVQDEIVWEWNIIDHVIQDTDPSGTAYGVVEDHPELLDIGALSTLDWTYQESFMINSMDYNPELDQIALSIRKLGEIVLIDHSTTTAEAAGHTGGKYGKGGDAIYRWGDPGNYGRATAEQRKELFLQHNPKWITEGPHKGKISVYNNNLGKSISGTPYSSAVVIDPPIKADGSYLLEDGKPYGPIEASIQIDRETTGTLFRSDYGSGIAVLPNENVFIANATGRLMEVDQAGEIQWEYQIPAAGFIYRCEKYPKSYPAFAGRNLTPGDQVAGAIENETCQVLEVEDKLIREKQFSVRYDGSNKMLYIENLQGGKSVVRLYGLDGRSLQSFDSQNAFFELDLSNLATGMYFVTLSTQDGQTLESHKVMHY